MSERIEADLRLFTLLLTLQSSTKGLTKHQIFALIPAYQAQSEAARERMFDRDKATLRELGAQLQVLESVGAEQVYKLQQVERPLRLNVQQRQALDLAARLWYDAQDWGSEHQLFRFKVDAYSFADPAAVKTIVDGGTVALSFLEAIKARQAVQFLYSKRGQRESALKKVLPQEIVFADNALYLSGVDFEQDAPRTYRLSRVDSGSIQAFDAFAPLAAGRGVANVGRQLTPRLLVHPDYVAQARFWASPVPKEGFEKPVALQAWQLYQGQPASFATWLERILTAPTQVLVLAPDDLQRAVVSLLGAGAKREGKASGN